jgi:hypothetical protein
MYMHFLMLLPVSCSLKEHAISIHRIAFSNVSLYGVSFDFSWMLPKRINNLYLIVYITLNKPTLFFICLNFTPFQQFKITAKICILHFIT